MLLAPLLAAAALAEPCPPNLANRLPAAPPGEQLITVEAASSRTTYATLRTWRRVGECWVAVGGGYPARVGRKGISGNRREGDGTTPTGTFPIGRTMYGNAPNPGVKFGYRRLRCGDWWDEDPSSPTYNSFQHVRCGVAPPFKAESEGMWQQPRAYAHLAVIEFNMRPVVPGRGSGIFLHVQTGGPTNGCIGLRRSHIVRVLRWLRPSASPHFVIGTTAQMRS